MVLCLYKEGIPVHNLCTVPMDEQTTTMIEYIVYSVMRMIAMIMVLL